MAHAGVCAPPGGPHPLQVQAHSARLEVDVLLFSQGFGQGGHGPGPRPAQQAVQGLLNPLPARPVGGKAGRLRVHGRQAPLRKAVQQCAHGGLAAVEVGRQLRDLHTPGREQQGLHPQAHARPQVGVVALVQQRLALVGGERGMQGRGHGVGAPVRGQRHAILIQPVK